MFNQQFFASKLGKAAMASVAAMVCMIALTTQMHADPAFAGTHDYQSVELA